MKNFLAFTAIIALLSVSCSKKKDYSENEQTYVQPSYDTTAVDSFSTGAISVDVAEQIRKSSAAYQDSLKKASMETAAAKLEAETKAKEEAKSREEENKKREETAKSDKKEAEKAD